MCAPGIGCLWKRMLLNHCLQAEGDSYSKDELMQDFPTLALL